MYGGAMESLASRSSSGCQSGWTLYLDHSNGNGMRAHRPCDPVAERCKVLQEDDDVEDSMASDASSGPRPLVDKEEDTRRDFEQRPQGCTDQLYSYSSSVHYCSASSDGSGGFCTSTCSSSRSSQAGLGHVGRRGVVVVQGGEATTTRQYREIVVGEGDDLDDTASSSAVFCNPEIMVHVNFPSCRKHQRSSHELRNI